MDPKQLEFVFENEKLEANVRPIAQVIDLVVLRAKRVKVSEELLVQEILESIR